MRILRTMMTGVLTFAATAMLAADYTVDGQYVTIPVKETKAGGAQLVRLQVVNDRIIRVQATSKAQLPEKQSLMIVAQTQKPKFDVYSLDNTDEVWVKAAKVMAKVNTGSGQITFYDEQERELLKESNDGKKFWDFTVPERELGMRNGYTVPEEQKHGLSWQMKFDSPDDEAFYGLGQHQSEEFNMKGKNEDLFQYNTKVSIPFVLSNKNYGLLWDSYSYCRFGNPNDYLQLNRAFILYDRNGKQGHLTGTYVDAKGKKLVRDEDSIYYEYGTPAKSAIALKTDNGGIKNFPKDFNLMGANVTYEGFIEPECCCKAQGKKGKKHMQLYQFVLYYSGYVKVYIDGKEVVPERWRTAWNPNTYKFATELQKGKRVQLRIEWRPDGGEAYCGLRVSEPRSAEERGKLSVWSEMAKDMDYCFIAGDNLDEVISGYRTLTGKASLYPKWVLGFWQSRERYKTQDEIEGTLAEFRQRQIPIDNIVQDWNYWPEDQWGSHQFEESRYPNPQQMLDKVHQMHGRFMISVWPKFYCNTDNYKELDAKGWMYVQSPTDDIHDWVGPGYKNGFYDAYDAGARKMFWRQMDENLYTKYNHDGIAGVDAWWMDASEPNVRDCTPMWYRKALSGPTALGTSTEYFNAYSTVNADAIYNGQRSVWKGKKDEPRVFLLTRSGFAGEQRFSTATWSGDIGTRWEDMRAQMTAGLNYSISGVPFWGMDQGGFCVENRYVAAQQLFDNSGVENEDLKEWRELQTRWNQFGAFIPLFRSHGQWPLREIWNIAPDNHPAYKSFVYYDKLRYRLMPYLYSMAGWAHFKDYTLMRPLIMDFNGDKEVENIGNQWMFGPALMACPVGYYKARNRSVYFPVDCGWYNLYTNEYVEGGQNLIVEAPYEQIPVFVREGAIIPFGPEMQWSDEKPAELINLYVYAGQNGKFQLYEDEGVNYNYEKGKYATIDIAYDDDSRTVTFSARKGNFPGMLKQRRFNVVLITKDQAKPLNLDNPEGTMVQYAGKEVSVKL
ncbi:MAG: DUF5110 domain-containing protein [Prevotella sp.]|nr:DUF5110 domain-containing protein [Prevotella sp.]